MNIRSKHHLIAKATLISNNGTGSDNGTGADDLSRIDAENKLAVLTLYDNGMIRDCNKAGARLLGCAPNKLTWQHISTIFPQLAEVALVKDERINPYLRFLSRIGHHFEVVSINGVRFACELFFNEVENLSQHCLRIIIQPIAQGRTTA